MATLIEWWLPMTGAVIWLHQCDRNPLGPNYLGRIGLMFSLAYLWIRFAVWAH